MSFRLVVLASGSGTNLQAILDQLHGHKAGDQGPVVELAGVASDKPSAGALVRAREAGVDNSVFPGSEYGGRAERDAAMADWIEARGAIVSVGNSGRKCSFEVYKIAAARTDISESAAEFLDEPILTMKAVGTTVVPKEHQRFSH